MIKNGYAKKMFSLLLALLISITSFAPSWAEEIPMPDFSPWAIQDLNEGERYGLYHSGWYYDGFRASLDKEKFLQLLQGVENRLIGLGLENAQNEKPYTLVNEISRGDFLGALFKLLGNYGVELLDTPEEHFVSIGVLKGTLKGNELESICTTEQAVIFSTRVIQQLYAELDAGSKGFMWVVENDGNKIYLLGSIHIGDSILYPISNNMKSAFHEADSLLVEANLFDQSGGMEYFMEKSMYQDGSTIKDHISEELYGKLLKALDLYGIPYEAFSSLKPWSLANNLNAINASSSENLEQGSQAAMLGIDIYFLSNALIYDIPINELEGISYQADMFDNLSNESQMLYLEGIIDSILDPEESEEEDFLQEWLVQWQSGDYETFKDSFMESMETEDDESEEITMMLFGERDKNMTNKIIDLLEAEGDSTYFLVVGAGHFTIENSIIDRLNDAGYNVEYIAE